ncbi:hypothetical protein ACI2JA_02600 [Alkalihalobacillus sp. NPDC078783]
MNTLIITSYAVGKDNEKSIIFKSTESKDIHQLIFDGLKELLQKEELETSPGNGEQLSINMIEQEPGQSLPRIQHVSVSGELEDRLLDRLEDIQDWMEQHEIKQVSDHSATLSKLVRDLS